MTKAKKGLIITLFAAMMVFAFGATSAFAADQPAPDKVVWATDGTSATVTFGTGAEAKTAALTQATFERTWSDGVVTSRIKYAASVNPGTLSEVEKMMYDWVGSLEPAAIVNEKNVHQYLDLGFSKVTNASDYSTYTYADFYGSGKTVDPDTGVISGQGIHVFLSAPTYVENYDDVKTQKKNVTEVKWYGGNARLAETVYAAGFTADSYVDMPVTLTATVLPRRDEDRSMPCVGDLSSNDITVKGMIPAADQVKLAVDTADNNADWTWRDNRGVYVYGYFDGETHKIVANEVPGFTVGYEVLNPDTKKWEKKDTIEFRNVGQIDARYTVYKDGIAQSDAQRFTVYVIQNRDNRISFDFDSSLKEQTRVEVAEGTDPVDFIVSGAFDVDAEEAMAYFGERFEIEATVNKADASKVDWQIKDKLAKDPDAKAALDKKYETLVTNYGNNGTLAFSSSPVHVQFVAVANDKFDDITFTYAPNATYKVKKAKKLKKTKSFTVEATAKSGNVVSYQLTTPNKKISIDPATGKITVKKGLKKGTYKVTVKATTDAGNGYRAAKESVKLTIKIKK